jgi:hypothetical protein
MRRAWTYERGSRFHDQDLERIIERDALKAREDALRQKRPTHVGQNCPVTSGP